MNYFKRVRKKQHLRSVDRQTVTYIFYIQGKHEVVVDTDPVEDIKNYLEEGEEAEYVEDRDSHRLVGQQQVVYLKEFC